MEKGENVLLQERMQFLGRHRAGMRMNPRLGKDPYFFDEEWFFESKDGTCYKMQVVYTKRHYAAPAKLLKVLPAWREESEMTEDRKLDECLVFSKPVKTNRPFCIEQVPKLGKRAYTDPKVISEQKLASCMKALYRGKQDEALEIAQSFMTVEEDYSETELQELKQIGFVLENSQKVKIDQKSREFPYLQFASNLKFIIEA